MSCCVCPAVQAVGCYEFAERRVLSSAQVLALPSSKLIITELSATAIDVGATLRFSFDHPLPINFSFVSCENCVSEIDRRMHAPNSY